MEKKVFLIVRLPCSAVGSSVSYPQYPSYLLLAEGELHLLVRGISSADPPPVLFAEVLLKATFSLVLRLISCHLL